MQMSPPLQRLMGGVEGAMPVMNGSAGAHGGEDYQQWMESKAAQGKSSPQTQRHGGDVYSNTLPVRKVAPAKSKTTLSKNTNNMLTHTVTCQGERFLRNPSKLSLKWTSFALLFPLMFIL